MNKTESVKLLHVHSLPLKDVITDLAKLFGVNYKVNCTEYIVEIPSSWGKGNIKGINFSGGLGLIIYNCSFHTDVEIHFVINEIHPLKFIYCLNGNLAHNFEKDMVQHQLLQYQNVIVASKGHNGHVLNFKKDTLTEIYSLEIDRKVFKLKMACEMRKAKTSVKDIFNDDFAKKSICFNGHYSLALAELFEDMKLNNHDHLLGKIFSESQSYRMLTHQLIQLDDDSNGDEGKIILRKQEVSAIMDAVEIIKTEMDTLDSMAGIAHRVGLSSQKFQNGFKTLYGKTANEYVQFLRLNLAKDLLINTDDSMKEIKFKIGFSSQSYFSELFKKTYSISPSAYRQKHRDGKNITPAY